MKVIVVDDDQTMVDVIVEKMNWKALNIDEVYQAYNIANAKKILTEHPVDIIISDIEMPQGSGLELLEWFREEGMDGEFLLLTSHERFDYASYAVRLHASEYLLKPFDPVMMEATLQKLIQKRKEDLAKRESANQGAWLASNMRRVRLNFFRRQLEYGENKATRQLEEELQGLDLPQDMHHPYTLLVSRVTDMEHDVEAIRQELFEFILLNIHGELLCDSADDGNVLLFKEENRMLLVSIVEDLGEEELQQRCEKLMERFAQLFRATLTICIGTPCTLPDFHERFEQCKEALRNYVSGHGDYFLMRKGQQAQTMARDLLPGAEMEQLLEQKDKHGFLSRIKSSMEEYANSQSLTQDVLSQLHREVLQVVYVYLGNAGISVTELFDENLTTLSQGAEASTMGMIRFCSYLVGRTLQVEAASKRQDTLTDKVDRYLREHFREELSTNDVADVFHLSGEYLNKAFRKEKGAGIKDYMNELRIEEAKRQLRYSDAPIGNIAIDVGFDNFTYFSTLFKKYVGVSPSQFRKTESGE